MDCRFDCEYFLQRLGYQTYRGYSQQKVVQESLHQDPHLNLSRNRQNPVLSQARLSFF